MICQKDYPNLYINNTTYSFSGYGCLISCLCEIAGVSVQTGLSKLKFNGALVDWSSIGNIGLELVENSAYDNDKVLKYIAENGQCIVRVDWDGSPLTDKDTHFVIFRGNKTLSDPIDGKDKPTSSYKLLTGIRAVKKVSAVVDPLKECLAQHTVLVTKCTDLESLIAGERSGHILELQDRTNKYQSLLDSDNKLITDLAQKLQLVLKNDDTRETWIKQIMTAIDDLRQTPPKPETIEAPIENVVPVTPEDTTSINEITDNLSNKQEECLCPTTTSSWGSFLDSLAQLLHKLLRG